MMDLLKQNYNKNILYLILLSFESSVLHVNNTIIRFLSKSGGASFGLHPLCWHSVESRLCPPPVSQEPNPWFFIKRAHKLGSQGAGEVRQSLLRSRSQLQGTECQWHLFLCLSSTHTQTNTHTHACIHTHSLSQPLPLKSTQFLPKCSHTTHMSLMKKRKSSKNRFVPSTEKKVPFSSFPSLQISYFAQMSQLDSFAHNDM